MNRTFSTRMAIGLAVALSLSSPAVADTPKVGDSAADFTLKTPAGESVSLASLNKKGPVVLVVLRGWPGYQCPICTKQVGELMAKSKELAAAKAQVLLVYPGPSSELKEHAEEFVQGKTLPDNFSLVIDPDYVFTNKYELRWDASRETAYPSTFVIDPKGKVVFAKMSKTHGDHAKIEDVLEALARK